MSTPAESGEGLDHRVARLAAVLEDRSRELTERWHHELEDRGRT